MPVDFNKVSDKTAANNEGTARSNLAEEAVLLAYGKPGKTEKTESAEQQKELERAAEQRLADKMTKNPALFATIVKSSFSAMDSNHDRGLTQPEVHAYAARNDIDPMSKSAAGVLDKYFTVMAGAYGSRKEVTSGDLEEFHKSLRLENYSHTSEALDSASKWGVGMYAASEYFDSDQSATNAGVSVISSLIGSTILAVKRERYYQTIKSLNYFELSDSK